MLKRVVRTEITVLQRVNENKSGHPLPRFWRDSNPLRKETKSRKGGVSGVLCAHCRIPSAVAILLDSSALSRPTWRCALFILVWICSGRVEPPGWGGIHARAQENQPHLISHTADINPSTTPSFRFFLYTHSFLYFQRVEERRDYRNFSSQ
jgi:hypothetical protein